MKDERERRMDEGIGLFQHTAQRLVKGGCFAALNMTRYFRPKETERRIRRRFGDGGDCHVGSDAKGVARRLLAMTTFGVLQNFGSARQTTYIFAARP